MTLPLCHFGLGARFLALSSFDITAVRLGSGQCAYMWVWVLAWHPCLHPDPHDQHTHLSRG